MDNLIRFYTLNQSFDFEISPLQKYSETYH